MVDYLEGTIIGVNRQRSRISIRFSNQQLGTYPVTRVLIGKGCVKRVCVGDDVTIENFRGTVIGVNSTTDQVAIRFTTNEIGTYMRREGRYGR